MSVSIFKSCQILLPPRTRDCCVSGREETEVIALKDHERTKQCQRGEQIGGSDHVPKHLTPALCPRLLLQVKLARLMQVISVAVWFRLFMFCWKFGFSSIIQVTIKAVYDLCWRRYEDVSGKEMAL